MRITATKLIENAIANYERPWDSRWLGLGRAMSGHQFTSRARATADELRIVAACVEERAAAPVDFQVWYDLASPEEMLEVLRLALAIVKKREARR